jgi:hypothetical protein
MVGPFALGGSFLLGELGELGRELGRLLLGGFLLLGELSLEPLVFARQGFGR